MRAGVIGGNRKQKPFGFVLVGLLVTMALAGTGAILEVLPKNASWAWRAGVLLGAFMLVVPLIRGIGFAWLGWGEHGPDGMRLQEPATVGERLFRESDAMADHALSRGLAVPATAMVTLSKLESTEWSGNTKVQADDVRRLAVAHKQLSQLVSPATPKSLRVLRDGSYNSFLPALGRVRLTRWLMYISTFLLVAFLVLALQASFEAPERTEKLAGSNRLFQAVDDKTKVVNALYLLSASGLGAAFFALHRANRYIAEGTFDQDYESTYWTRFALGVMAGMILALLIPINGELTKPLLALLGGFSADIVYRILGRLVETLDALVQGSNKEAIAVERREAQARADLAALRSRSQGAEAVLQLKAALAQAADPATVQPLIDQLLTSLVVDDAIEEAGLASTSNGQGGLATASAAAADGASGEAESTQPDQRDQQDQQS